MAASDRGPWARYVRDVLQEAPGVWHEPLEREVPSRVKYAQHRLKALGADAVIVWHGLTAADLRCRWVYGVAPDDPRSLDSGRCVDDGPSVG